jgi:hypothetical protein
MSFDLTSFLPPRGIGTFILKQFAHLPFSKPFKFVTAVRKSLMRKWKVSAHSFISLDRGAFITDITEI